MLNGCKQLVYDTIGEDEQQANLNIADSATDHSLFFFDAGNPLEKGREKAYCISVCYWKPMEKGKYWWVSWFVTNSDEKYLCKGYGTMLMMRLQALARSSDGVQGIYLDVNPD